MKSEELAAAFVTITPMTKLTYLLLVASVFVVRAFVDLNPYVGVVTSVNVKGNGANSAQLLFTVESDGIGRAYIVSGYLDGNGTPRSAGS